MRAADIIGTLERLIEDIENRRPSNTRQVHKVKTWLRAERERLDAKRALTASQLHKMADKRMEVKR